MCPVLFEVPQPPAWVAVVLALALGAAALLVELREQRRRGARRNRARAAGITALAALVGVGIWYGLARWGPVQVRSWGTMLMFGFAAGMLWALHDAREDETITLDLMIDVTLAILVGAIIGSRIMSVVLEWDAYAARPGSVFRIWEGGLSFHGGLIGGTLGGSLLMWRRGLSVPRMADLLVPSVTLGYAITKVGCFLNGCCYGVPTDLPWGVHFPTLADPDVARHPTQLYGSALSLVVFGLLLAFRRRLHHPGHLALLYLVLYSGARFGVEHFRRGASAVVFEPLAPLTYAQVASIAIALAAGAWMFLDARRAGRRARERETDAPAAASENTKEAEDV